MKKLIIIVFISLAILLFNNPILSAEGWGFKKNKDHLIPDIGRYAKIIENKNAYYIGNKDKIYLTFDCGYDNGNIQKILATLKEKQVAATFFVTGDFVNRFTPLLEQIVREGHVVGSHSYRHMDIAKSSEEQIIDDLSLLEERYFEKMNTQIAKIFRPPEGSFDEKSLKIVDKLGYKTIFWSIAYVDWNKDNVDSYQQVIENLHDGAIILMHPVSNGNVNDLPKIIDKIRENGYQFDVVTNI